MVKILLIDDDRRFNSQLKSHVAEYYPCLSMVACADPLEALLLLRIEKYDLLLIDYEVPPFDGQKLLQYAIQAGVERNRIVLLSGHDAAFLHKVCPSGRCLAVLNKFEAAQREVLDMILSSLNDKAEKAMSHDSIVPQI
ncbi:response regulator transcription factor [Trichlorobacter lovleyi]|uniref:Response regulator receiver protein n=1 Tax=Trichlorobacter lovleyi (strain ATCC BAA-1151 / DSM 17278 / SZ) TaxID=398767 RepID=B3E9K6_TRIL1|nr:response regulator [Trichlorobacter lovleyi]ACD95282.1 response regulator receiver protein [Trichlorobacter lovleyi SZ]QOX78576.1 response regulator [Trichlorobacter lovleyi]